MTEAAADRAGALIEAVQADDAAGVRQLFEKYPSLRERVNDPIGPFDSPPLNSVRSREMIDALLDAGADLNAKSRWWAGGFGVMHLASPELAAYAVERGAEVDIHAAAAWGDSTGSASWSSRTRSWCTPAAATARLRSTSPRRSRSPRTCSTTAPTSTRRMSITNRRPRNTCSDDRPDVARYLVERGCRTDILLASAVGDVERVRSLLDADPGCLRVRGNAAVLPDGEQGGGRHHLPVDPGAERLAVPGGGEVRPSGRDPAAAWSGARRRRS